MQSKKLNNDSDTFFSHKIHRTEHMMYYFLLNLFLLINPGLYSYLFGNYQTKVGL